MRVGNTEKRRTAPRTVFCTLSTGGGTRNRTEVNGFADRRVTSPPYLRKLLIVQGFTSVTTLSKNDETCQPFSCRLRLMTYKDIKLYVFTKNHAISHIDYQRKTVYRACVRARTLIYGDF